MRKYLIAYFILIIFFIFILTTSSNLVLAKTVRETLDFINLENSTASGIARMSILQTKNNLQKVSIQMKLKDLRLIENTAYEGWLVDENTGYKLSLGAFTPMRTGKASFIFRQMQINFSIYDRIIITRESLYDNNPNPTTPILLVNIPNLERNQIKIELIANLNNLQETTGSNSTAIGTGYFTINTEFNLLAYSIVLQNLEGETAAHIHGPASKTQSAPPLHTLSLGDQKIGIWNYPEEQEQNILNGLTYVNIHSALYPAGEIRSQIESLYQHLSLRRTPEQTYAQYIPTRGHKEENYTSNSSTLNSDNLNYKHNEKR